MGDTTDIPYALVSSAIRLRGNEVTSIDRYSRPERSTIVEDLQVELVQRADARASHLLRSGGRGDQDLSVKLAPDGRLQSVEYKAAGVGGTVVTAGAKVLAFIGGVAKAVLSVAHDAPAGIPPPDPRDDWKRAHPDEATQLDTNRALATKAAEMIGEVRGRIVVADGVVEMRNLVAREKTIEATLQAARAEVGRLEELYRVWRDGQRTTSTASVEWLIDLERIPERRRDALPAASTLDDDLRELWEDWGIRLEIVDAERSASVDPDDRDSQYVYWRAPRPVELWIWKLTPQGLALVRRSPIRIVDVHSATPRMEMRASIFGEHGGTWTFNDDGSPSALKLKHESAVGAFANALAGVPDAVVHSVEQAAKLSEAWSGLEDAQAEREKVSAQRELATARARLDLLGLHATADDFAALQRAEQAVKLRTATRATSAAADAVDDLKRQLELVTTQAKIESERRAAMLESDLADTKADLARLNAEVQLAKARRGGDDPAGAADGVPLATR